MAKPRFKNSKPAAKLQSQVTGMSKLRASDQAERQKFKAKQLNLKAESQESQSQEPLAKPRGKNSKPSSQTSKPSCRKFKAEALWQSRDSKIQSQAAEPQSRVTGKSKPRAFGKAERQKFKLEPPNLKAESQETQSREPQTKPRG